jgi:alpha-tubulin suppressor-like RCC1 family protein
MRCWGYNFFSQLGDGKTHDEEQFSTVPVTVIGITDAVAVMTGYSYSCAVLAGGTVKCWGGNDSGQLGVGSFKDSKTPTAVSGITGAIAAASGEGADACAVLTGGSIRCWGNDYDGQLGNGTLGYSTLPVSVIGFGGP